MSIRISCGHVRARFHEIDQSAGGGTIELWHCPDCRRTVSVNGVRASSHRPAAA